LLQRLSRLSLQTRQHANCPPPGASYGGVDTYDSNKVVGGGTLTIRDIRRIKDVFNFSDFTGNPICGESVSAGPLHIMLQNHTSIALMHETRL
jgi:hypothetical protein